jgi:hypothetical protein
MGVDSKGPITPISVCSNLQFSARVEPCKALIPIVVAVHSRGFWAFVRRFSLAAAGGLMDRGCANFRKHFGDEDARVGDLPSIPAFQLGSLGAITETAHAWAICARKPGLRAALAAIAQADGAELSASRPLHGVRGNADLSPWDHLRGAIRPRSRFPVGQWRREMGNAFPRRFEWERRHVRRHPGGRGKWNTRVPFATGSQVVGALAAIAQADPVAGAARDLQKSSGGQSRGTAATRQSRPGRRRHHASRPAAGARLGAAS